MADSTRLKTSNGGCQWHLKNQKWWAPLKRNLSNPIRWPSVGNTKLKIPEWWVLLSHNIAQTVYSVSAKITHVMGTINPKSPKYWTPKAKIIKWWAPCLVEFLHTGSCTSPHFSSSTTSHLYSKHHNEKRSIYLSSKRMLWNKQLSKYSIPLVWLHC